MNKNPNNIWLTSDTHFNHPLMQKMRGFDSVEEMNEVLIERWNAKVKRGDTVYHHGDFGFPIQKTQLPKWVKRLNGTINLLIGNHDKLSVNVTGNYGFNWIKHYNDVKLGDYTFKMFHYPILSWHHIQNPNVFHTFGHVHGKMKPELIPYRCMDVGIDTREDLSLYHVDEVVEILLQKPQFHYDFYEER